MNHVGRAEPEPARIVAGTGAVAALGGGVVAVRRGWSRAFDAHVATRELTPHEIRRGDIPAFVAASELQSVQFHATSATGVEHLRRAGTGDLAHRGAPGVFGAGFYTSTRSPERTYGPATAAVVIDARVPLVVRSNAEFDAAIERMDPHEVAGTWRSMQEVREVLLDHGHDSIVYQRRMMRDWVVAIKSPDQVKVVVTDGALDPLGSIAASARRGLARSLAHLWAKL